MVIKDSNLKEAQKLVRHDFLNDDLVLVQNTDDMEIPDYPIRFNYTILGLCLEGEIQIEIDTKKYSITGNSFFSIFNGQVMDKFKKSPDLKVLFLLVSDEVVNEVIIGIKNIWSMYLFLQDHQVLAISQEDRNIMINYFKLVQTKLRNKNNKYRKEITLSLLLAMLYEFTDHCEKNANYDSTEKSRKHVILGDFIKLINQNFRTERRVSWYAQQLFITPKHLSETIKKTSKHSPNEWIDKFVILEIKVLLKNTDKSIKEISSSLNFPNQSFLGKYFKEHTGMPPSQYRKTN